MSSYSTKTPLQVVQQHFGVSSAGFQPQFTAPGGHPLHLRSYLPPHVTLVALDGRTGTPVGGGNARRIALDPYVRNATSMRLRSVELPLSFTQFSAARGNTCFAVNADAMGFGGTVVSIPDSNHTAATLRDAMNHSTAAAPLNLEFEITEYGGPLRFCMKNTSNTVITVLFAADARGGLKRELPASQLGWALGFRQAMYTIEPGATVVAEAGVTTQPLRSALVRLGASPAFLRDGFQAAQAGETVAKVLLPPSELFGSNADTASVHRQGTVMCATEANGLLQSGTRVFRDTASVANTPASGAEIRHLDVEILDEFGRALDLQGDTFSLTLEIAHG